MTFKSIEKVLLGCIGYTPDEMRKMTVSQVLNAYAGFREHEKEVIEAQKIITWEAIRWQTWWLHNITVERKYRKRSPMHIMKFEWEKTPRITEEEKERLKEASKRFPKRLKNGNTS